MRVPSFKSRVKNEELHCAGLCLVASTALEWRTIYDQLQFTEDIYVLLLTICSEPAVHCNAGCGYCSKPSLLPLTTPSLRMPRVGRSECRAREYRTSRTDCFAKYPVYTELATFNGR